MASLSSVKLARRSEEQERQRRQTPVEPHQHDEGDEGAEHAADHLHETGADEIPDALCVGHDARDQLAALVVLAPLPLAPLIHHSRPLRLLACKSWLLSPFRQPKGLPVWLSWVKRMLLGRWILLVLR